jgi:hypothetical protein
VRVEVGGRPSAAVCSRNALTCGSSGMGQRLLHYVAVIWTGKTNTRIAGGCRDSRA